MSYEKTTWAAGDKVTSAKLNNIENGVENVTEGLSQLNLIVNGVSETIGECLSTANNVSGKADANAASIEALSGQVAQNAEAINTNAGILDSNGIDIDYLFDKLTVLEEKVNALRKTNVVPKSVAVAEFPETSSNQAKDNVLNLNQAEDDLVLTVEEELVNKFLNVTAKSVDAKDMSLTNSKFDATATGDIDVTNLTTSGNLAKSNSNSMMSFNSPEYITIKDSALGESGYNCVEIGLKVTNNTPVVPKGVLIENVDFTGTCSNNAISVFGAQDNAVITVKDCTFNKVSNAFRWSNKTNATNVTINFVNCDFVDVEDTLDYHGAILCQNFTDPTAEAVEASNLFAPEKLTINFVNCVYEGNKLEAVEDASTICNTHNENQLVYIYNDKGNPALPPYDAAKCPVINIR